jgi:plastocyanin
MRFLQFAVVVLLMVASGSVRAMDGTCHCSLSVIAATPGLNVSGGVIRGPCGRPMSMAGAISAGSSQAVAAPVPQQGDLAAASATASVQDNFFSPNPVTINVGDTVQWTWAPGSNFHSVTSVIGSLESFDSGDISVGSFSHTFTHAGTYVYYCDIHGFDFGNGTAGGMFATITVNAVPEPMAALLVLPLLVLARPRRSR